MKSLPLAAKFIYLATFAECSGSINRPTVDKGIDFIKNDNDAITIFLHFNVYLITF